MDMILDGKKIKNQILDELKDEVNNLTIKPKLVVIQVGNNEASNVYIKQKNNMCNYIGYNFEHFKLDEDTNIDNLLELIYKLNNDDSVNGILVQLPLPKHIDSNKIINAISPVKDVDGLTDTNIGMLCHKKDSLYSCTPYGVMELLDRYDIDVSEKNVVIVGRSDLVGKPMSMMMLNKDATVTICHSKTNNLTEFTKKADILIVAIGKPNFITTDMIREDAIVIDVGISRTELGLCGDVDFDSVKDKVKYITPVPGGVGPMTVAMLGKNILKAYKLQNK
ncbi:MAG: bifunctional methylenetetrahydrofolate dehydrogenase/methenyltetrahydrofolate cyclohydrolase FolD [Bacilli bacterium]|nr:bifunctional methylenetetrahydrofolate dehydrogenase/methenyltetrahydrofolate cyclohydrolase FolD [Bacilli bacterium]